MAADGVGATEWLEMGGEKEVVSGGSAGVAMGMLIYIALVVVFVLF